MFGEGGYGTPYIDCDCSLEGPFTIVYGHHMDDGSVFADFASFSDESYAREHQMINLYTRADNQRHELRVAAIDVVNASYETLQTGSKTRGSLPTTSQHVWLKAMLFSSDKPTSTTCTPSQLVLTRPGTPARLCMPNQLPWAPANTRAKIGG